MSGAASRRMAYCGINLNSEIFLTREYLVRRSNFVPDVGDHRCLASNDEGGTQADLVVECRPLAGSRPFGVSPIPLARGSLPSRMPRSPSRMPGSRLRSRINMTDEAVDKGEEQPARSEDPTLGARACSFVNRPWYF